LDPLQTRNRKRRELNRPTVKQQNVQNVRRTTQVGACVQEKIKAEDKRARNKEPCRTRIEGKKIRVGVVGLNAQRNTGDRDVCKKRGLEFGERAKDQNYSRKEIGSAAKNSGEGVGTSLKVDKNCHRNAIMTNCSKRGKC